MALDEEATTRPLQAACASRKPIAILSKMRRIFMIDILVKNIIFFNIFDKLSQET